jgi:chemotaxis protein CheD
MNPSDAVSSQVVREVPAGQDVFLMPGQLYFGRKAARVRTLLGSCVAVTLWHPGRRLGGMCHFLLPQRRRDAADPLDGRYGDEAMAMLVQALKAQGTRPAEYQAHLYGGADTLPEHLKTQLNVGERNIEMGWNAIEAQGFQLMSVDVGDHVPRHVTLDLLKGEVSMRRGGKGP